MKRALLLSSLLLASACRDFDARLDAGCENGAAWCRDAGDAPDGGQTFDAGAPFTHCTMPVDTDCIGQGAWCWERPSPLGLTDVASIWGRADDDFFIAGSGGVIAHWNGANWQHVAVSLPLDGPTRYEPRVHVVLCREQGFVLAGDAMAVHFQADGGWQRTGDSIRRFSASRLGDSVALLRDTSSEVELLRPRGPLQLVTRPPDGARRASSVLLLDDGPHLAFKNDDEAGIWLPDGGDAPLSLTRGPLNEAPLQFFSVGGVPTLGFRNGRVLQASGAGWAEREQLPVSFEVESMGVDDYGDGGLDWWATGQGHRVFHGSHQFNGGELTLQGEFARTSWVTPQRAFIAAGANGRVVRVDDERSVTELGSGPEPELRDLAVDGDEVVAVGQGVFWWRSGGQWNRLGDGMGADLRAVTLDEGNACTVDGTGRVACMARGGNALEVTTLSLGPNRAADAWRGGAIGVREGDLRATVGGVVGLETNGTWQQFALDAGSVSVDLVPTSDGAWVALGNPDGSGTYLRDGRVLFVDTSGATVACALPAASGTGGVYSLARTTTGVWAAGNGWAGKCENGGTYTAMTALPPDPFIVSIYEDVQNRVWVVTNDGRVYWRASSASSFTRDRSPGGWSDQTNTLTRRLTGTADTLWLGVGTGGILRRPLAP